MATISNGESGSSVRTKLNEIINKVEGVTSIDNNIDITGTLTSDGLTVETATSPKITISENTGTGTASLDFVATSSFPKTKITTDIAAASMAFSTIGNDRMLIASNGDISFYEDTGTTAKFFWDASAESLGIGDDNPLSILHVGSGLDANVPITLAPASGGNVEFRSTTSTGSFTFTNANGSNEKMRIDSSGNLLVNSTNSSPSGKIHVETASGQYGISVDDTFGNNVFVDFLNDGTRTGSIAHNNSGTTSYNTTSDYRAKQNIVDLTGATARLKQLSPKRFNFIAYPDGSLVDGFIAHEVQTVVPEAITGTHNEVDADGNPVYQGIDQSKLVPLLVATIKELEARITALENA